MNFFIKTRGSVSVFLIIILVPMIAITTIFIDASRIKLAKGLADSATDLTVNTVLTRYDTDLSDYYGLMASCQDVDEFYDVAQGYFTECIVSQGVTPTLAQEFATDIMDIVKGKATINDFLLIDTEKTSATIEPVEGANLANAAVIKSEIVEFMKYRAPINLLTSTSGKKGLYSKLTEVQKHIEVMPAEMEIQNNKLTYYNKENELMEHALDVYKLLVKYEEYVTDKGLDQTYLETTVKTDMGAVDDTKGLIADYKELHRKYVSNWANTKDYDQFQSVETRMNSTNLEASGSNLSKSAVINAIKDCNTARATYGTALTNLNNALNEVEFEDYEEAVINKNQYWVQLEKLFADKGDVYEKYVTALIDFHKSRKKMSRYYNNRADGTYVVQEDRTRTVTVKVLDEDGKEVIDEKTGIPKMTTKVETYKEDVTKTYDIKTDGFGDGRTIEKAYTDTENMAGAVTDYKNERIHGISKRMEKYSKEALTAGATDNVVRTEADAEIAAALTALEQEYAVLVETQNKIKELLDAKNLPKLKTLVREYAEAFDDWETSVDNNIGYVDDSDIILKDSEQIADVKGERENEATNIRESDVEEFTKRLENTEQLIQSYLDVMASIKYRGKAIFSKDSKITSVNGFDEAANATPSGKPAIELKPVHVTQSELDKYIEETWESENKFAELVAVSDGKAGNNPTLHNATPSSDGNCTKLDRWFHEKFPTDLDELTANLSMLTQLKKMMNRLAETVQDMKGYEKVYYENVDITGSNLPSGGGTVNTDPRFNQSKPDYSKDNALEEQLKSTQESSGKIFDKLDFTDLASAGMENLYATMYIMNMFSYDTSALEGLYEMLGGGSNADDIYKMSDGNRIKPANAGTYYDDLLMKDPSTQEGDWWNTKKSFTLNKTLTNKMLDKEHCISYGNEVEYILYGDGYKESKDKLYLTMATTRFALNFGPVLQVYWSDTDVTKISGAISGATQGIIPAPLVKLIICLGVCAAESAADMNYLKAGLPVAFYKSDAENQLFIELTLDETGMMQALKDNATDYVTNNMSVWERSITSSDAPFSYSDYLSVYLFIALCADEDPIYKRTADVIQLNMIENYPELGEYQLEKAITYFSIEADVRIKPLMMELPYAKMCGIEVPEDAAWNMLHSEAVRGY